MKSSYRGKPSKRVESIIGESRQPNNECVIVVIEVRSNDVAINKQCEHISSIDDKENSQFKSATPL